jgi:hypothetical protein
MELDAPERNTHTFHDQHTRTRTRRQSGVKKQRKYVDILSRRLADLQQRSNAGNRVSDIWRPASSEAEMKGDNKTFVSTSGTIGGVGSNDFLQVV